jgi:hypothetical protein
VSFSCELELIEGSRQRRGDKTNGSFVIMFLYVRGRQYMHLSFKTTIDQLETTKFAPPPSKAKNTCSKIAAIYFNIKLYIAFLESLL